MKTTSHCKSGVLSPEGLESGSEPQSAIRNPQFFATANCVLPTVFFLILALSPPSTAFSQIPQGFNYQAIAKDGSGIPIPGQTLPVRISIQSDSLGGTVFWVELHSNVSTNSSGLFTLVVGKGARQSGTAATFSAIDWSVWPKYIQTEIDFGGWKNLGSSKMWSVPYAMVSTTSDTWTTSGANIYRPSGNVGIGTSSPIGSLGLSTDGGGTYLSLVNTSAGGRRYLLGSTGLGNGQGEGKFVIWDWDASANRFTIDPSGNVGIGTTNPTFKFQVMGGESLFGYNGGNGSLRFTTGFGNSFMFKPLDHALELQTDHTGFPVVMYLDKSGFIGFGNTDPGYIMDISGRIRLRTGVGSAGLWLNDAANTSVRSFIGMYDDDRVGFYGVGSTWGTIMNVNNGNVGIGTTDPGAYRLNINGGPVLINDGTGINGVLKLTGHSYVGSADWGNLYLFSGVNGGLTSIRFITENVERMYITGNGNVGIGVWPAEKFHVAGNIVSSGNLTIGGTYQGQAGTGYGDVLIVGNDSKLSDVNLANTIGIIGLQDANQGHIRLGTTGPIISGYNGNIGIGNTTPASKLSVQVPAENWADEVPLFEVKNKKGIPVFAVYNYGVRVLVDHNTATKAPKGGFQVSSYDYSKAGGTTPLMIINPDSIRFNIDNGATKGAKGGFSVGSFADAKGIDQDFMYITPKGGSGGDYNTYLGYETGKNSSGPHNTYLGYNAGKGLSGNSSASNIFIGEGSGLNNSGGYEAFALQLPDGSWTSVYNSWGGENVAIGNYTGVSLAGSSFPPTSKNNGKYNVMLGNYAGFKLNTGSKNVMLGYQAGNNIVTGSSNVFIGYMAGSQETGSNKLYIDNTNITTPLIYGDFDLNYIKINGWMGIDAVPGTPFAIAGLTGTTSGSSLRILDNNIYYYSSSRKTKSDIQPFNDDFYKILKAQPVSFKDKVSGERNIGFIAEDFDAIGLNELVVYKNGEPISLNYELISIYNLEIIKDQQKRIELQEDKIDKLEKMILELEQRIASSR